MTQDNPNRILLARLFPSLDIDTDPAIKTLFNSSKVIQLEINEKAFIPGASCNHYLLLIKGHLRVQILTDSGRQVVLYHVNPGDDCVLTTSCLFAGNRYPAEGITESRVTAVVIPANIFHKAIEQSLAFRQFVFSTFSKRLTDVITRIELSYSTSVEKQLAQKLLTFEDSDHIINMTHQQLACEIGSVREVVSRQLKKFENKGWIKMSRGRIEVSNPQMLSHHIIS